MIGPGLVFLALVIASTITLYYLIRTRHLENMARIEHGMAPDDRNGNGKGLLSLGIFLCSLGSGFLLAHVVSTNTLFPENVAMPVCLLFAGGMGLIASHLVGTNTQK